MKRCLIFILILLFCFGCAQREVAQPDAQANVPTVVPTAVPQSAPTETPPEAEEIELIPEVTVTETPVPLPTQPPTPTPTPSPEPTPTPEPTKDPTRPMVALTFDDGPNLTLTVPVLEKLEQYHVKATFFLLASAINDRNGYMLQMMIDGGHEIGVHGLTHENMKNFSAAKNTKRLRSAAEEISGWVSGGYTPKLMRPPGGNKDGKVIRGARDAGMAVIIWSVDTADWQSQNVRKIMDVVKKKTKDGAIILCHDHHKPTLDALDEMIPWLLEQGYDLVTVSELIESTGQEVQPGKVYYNKFS